MIGELAGLNAGENSNTVRLLHYTSHNGYVSNVNSLFEAYRCQTCDQFNIKAGNLDSKLTTCKERVSIFFPKMCMSSVKHCLADLTRLVSFIETTETSSKTKSFLTLNQGAWKLRIVKILKQTPGLGGIFQFGFCYRSTWCKNPLSSAILTLVTWYQLSLMLWRILLRKVKLKWKWTSSK